MTFIDISYRLALMALVETGNARCNIRDLGVPTSGFAKIVRAHLIGHPRLGGGCI